MVGFTLPQCLQIIEAFNSDLAFAINARTGKICRLGCAGDGEGMLVTRINRTNRFFPREEGPFTVGTFDVSNIPDAFNDEWFLNMTAARYTPNLNGLGSGDGEWSGTAWVGSMDPLVQKYKDLHPKKVFDYIKFHEWFNSVIEYCSRDTYGKVPIFDIAEVTKKLSKTKKSKKKAGN